MMTVRYEKPSCDDLTMVIFYNLFRNWYWCHTSLTCTYKYINRWQWTFHACVPALKASYIEFQKNLVEIYGIRSTKLELIESVKVHMSMGHSLNILINIMCIPNRYSIVLTWTVICIGIASSMFIAFCTNLLQFIVQLN